MFDARHSCWSGEFQPLSSSTATPMLGGRGRTAAKDLSAKMPTAMPGTPAMPEMPSDVDVHAPMNPWKELVASFLRTLRAIPGIAMSVVQGSRELVVSIVLIAVFVLLIILGYVTYFVLRPRFFTISHSSAFEKYMVSTCAEVADTMHRLDARMKGGDLNSVFGMDNNALQQMSECGDSQPSTSESMRTIAERVTEELSIPVSRPDLATDVRLYFQYHRSLSSLKPDDKPVPNILAKMDFKTEPDFQNDISGEADTDKVVKFHSNVFLPISHLRDDVTALSVRLSAACAVHHPPNVVRAIMDIHLLRLHLDVYHAQTSLSYETRKSGPGRLPTAIMTLYWWPLVEPTYSKAIPNLWTEAPTEFKDGLNAYESAWAFLGKFILHLPCYMSYMSSSERDEKCGTIQSLSDSFVDGKRIVEGFSLGGLINGIGLLLMNIIPMVIHIAQFIILLATDPFQAIFGIFMLVLGMGLGLWSYLWYVFLTLTQFYWIPGVFYAFVISYVYAFILSFLEVVFTIALAVPYLIMTLIDLLTAGMIMQLLRCESLPSEWASQPFTAFDNVRGRFGLGCSVPCNGASFVPSYEVMCYCMPPDTPPFCPQQQLFRAYRGLPLGDPWIFDGFTADSAFHVLDPKDQQRQMAKAYDRKTEFLGRCYSAVSPFSFITRHICADLDTLLPDVSSKDKARLATLCHQAHCNFGPSSTLDPSNVSASPPAVMHLDVGKASFCQDAERLVIKENTVNPTSGMARLILFMVLASCLALVILYSLLG